MSIITFPYLSNFFMVLTSIVLGGALSATICISLKKNHHILGFTVFCAFCIYMAFLVAPTPRQVDRMVITHWIQLDNNKVTSNGLRNTVLMGCHDRGFLDGHTFQSALDAFMKDIDNHLDQSKESSDGIPFFQIQTGINEQAQKYTDACKFADENYPKSASF